MKQMNWWLDEDLVERIRDYQFANRIDSTTEAARRLLEESLQRWEEERVRKERRQS